MKRVKLGGRELRIEDSAVAEFLQKGYSVIDDSGNVLQKGHVTNYNQAIEENKILVEENSKLRGEIELYSLEIENRKKEIEELKATNGSLSEELAAAKAQLDELKKAADKESKSK